MLIADGGGYGGTSWTGMDVVQMWQAVENQDTTAHYRLLTGWQRSYELTLQHLGQVQNYRQSLAEAWPPEKSAASAAYLQRLDGLIADLQSTYDAAVANHSAFASATLALSLSRNDVKKIYDEYTANQTKLEEFKNRPPVPAAKSAVPPPKPPVADGRQEQLNNQARSIMFGLSGEIIQARAQITKPKIYTEAPGVDGGDKNDNGPQFVAPPIPPVQTFDPGAGASHSGGSSSSHQPTNTAPAPPKSAQPGTAHQPQPGLVLGGAQTTAPGPPPGGITVQPPPSNGGLPTTISPSPLVPTTPLRSTLPPGAMRFVPGEVPGRAFVGGLPGGPRPMPPGGVIGGAPGIGLTQPGAGGRAASRVNPVGGVINSENAAGRGALAGRGGASSGQPLPSTGGRGADRHADSEESLRWDPDNPWETTEGVAPVVLPATEQRIDPGPAIGLH